MNKLKPRMTCIYGIWSCVSPGAYGVSFDAETAYRNWQERASINVWSKPRDPKKEVIHNQRFG